ncbi:hypothetical protein JD969_04160 [Planctomycetota bacterium]|nr:hypothetical protein JD969_04160 [Planctomycetota bacterium]
MNTTKVLFISILAGGLFMMTACSDKSLVPGDDPYYSQPEESQEAQKLDEEEQYVDETPTLNQNEDGDANYEYTMEPPDQYGE